MVQSSISRGQDRDPVLLLPKSEAIPNEREGTNRMARKATPEVPWPGRRRPACARSVPRAK